VKLVSLWIDAREIEELLAEASLRAQPGWETAFVRGFRRSFDQYGLQMEISGLNLARIEQIAGWCVSEGARPDGHRSGREEPIRWP
jgi:hypothetical protein